MDCMDCKIYENNSSSYKCKFIQFLFNLNYFAPDNA